MPNPPKLPKKPNRFAAANRGLSSPSSNASVPKAPTPSSDGDFTSTNNENNRNNNDPNNLNDDNKVNNNANDDALGDNNSNDEDNKSDKNDKGDKDDSLKDDMSSSLDTSQDGGPKKVAPNTDSDIFSRDKGKGGKEDLMDTTSKKTKKGVTEEDSNPFMSNKKEGIGKKIQKNLRRLQSAIKGYKLYQLYRFFNMLWQKAMEILGMIANFLAFLGKFVMGAIAAAKGFIAGIVSFVTGASSAIASVIATGVMVSVPAVLAVALAVSSINNQRYDSGIDCKTEVADVIEQSTGDVSGLQLKNATLIYSVFKKLGFSDIMISGILGNFQQESQMDFSCIEGINNEPGRIGPRKQKALSDFTNYCFGDLFPRCSICKPPLYKVKGYGHDGETWPGIGIGQWTGGETSTKLFAFADKVGKKWYDPDVQLIYMLAVDARSDRRKWLLKEWKNENSSTPEQATARFAYKWEGNTQAGKSERPMHAKKWYARIKAGELKVDDAFASSVISQAKQLESVALDAGISDSMAKCLTTQNYDNSTLVNAILSYCFATEDEGYQSDGTELWRTLKPAIFPQGHPIRSCDITVAVAVRWSGTDINYPKGDVATQKQYLHQHSEKWQQINWGGDRSKLQPGDILIRKDPAVSHTLMYVGEDAIKKKFGSKAKPGSCVASGSLHTRSPSAGQWDSRASVGYSTYEAFRCIKPDNSDKYKSLGGGAAVQ